MPLTSKLLSFDHVIPLCAILQSWITIPIDLHNSMCTQPQNKCTNKTIQLNTNLACGTRWWEWSFKISSRVKRMLKTPTINVPTTLKHGRVYYGNLQSSTHEDFSEMFSFSIEKGNDSNKSLNTRMTCSKGNPNIKQVKTMSVFGTMGWWFRVYDYCKDIHPSNINGCCGFFLVPIIQLHSWWIGHEKMYWPHHIG